MHRLFTTSVADVYPHYVAKVERKGRSVDEHRTWVALYHPTYTGAVPGLRRIETLLAMLVDFKLVQRQDRAVFESLPPGPSDLSAMATMPADRGVTTWIRTWQEHLDTHAAPEPTRARG